MIIKIEVDVEPEELRRFLGLPDVMTLQEDMVRYLRDKLASSLESLDTNALTQNLRRSRPWKKLVEVASTFAPELAPAEDTEGPRAKPKRRRKPAN